MIVWCCLQSSEVGGCVKRAVMDSQTLHKLSPLYLVKYLPYWKIFQTKLVYLDESYILYLETNFVRLTIFWGAAAVILVLWSDWCVLGGRTGAAFIIRSISLWRQIQLLCFWALSIVLFLFKTHSVSETGFCLRPQVEATQLGPIDIATPYLRKPAESESESESLYDWRFTAN
jgi:hypothetical protein